MGKTKGRKRSIFLFFAGMAVLMLTFSGTALAYSEKDPLVLKCAIDNPPGDMKARTIKRIGDIVEERTKGRIKFEYFYGGSLIKKPQYVDAVAKGIADISTGPVSFITGKIPELSIFEVYGAYRLDTHLKMQEAVEPLLTKLFEKKGIHHVMLQYTGDVIFAHKTKFLKKPEDWKGQKMRLAGRWQSELGKMWGASPVFLLPNDLYLALQRGVIDGYMLIYDIIYGLKLYEVAPYQLDGAMSNNIENVTMNLKKWNTMTKEDQAIFNAAVKEVKPWNYYESLKYYETIKKDMVSKGAKIYKLNQDEKRPYLKDSYSLYPEVKKVSGPMGAEFMKILAPFRDK
jgi:TRAP-type C4-dicarboxylate transport system substrate-binding protein